MSKKKKVLKKVKKQYKKAPKAVKFSFILLLIVIVGVTYLLYSQGYLNFLFEQNSQPDFVAGVHEQNEDGFYYYQDTGLNEGQYYASIKDLTSDELVLELKNILNVYQPVSYGDARYVLALSDRDPKDDFKSVRGIYDNDKIATEWIGKGDGAWQREHVWPNSKLGIPRVENHHKNQGSDLHNLRAITGINQTRSNRFFEIGSGDAKKIGTEAFYPGDEHKGDVARILFYMTIMYDVLSLTDDEKLLKNNADTNYTQAGAYSGKLSLLIKWHKEDPVDEFEMRRNDIIYSGDVKDPSGKKITPQGNRNPFIDKPELVHLIWEEKSIEDLIKPVDEIIEEIAFNGVYLILSNDLVYVNSRRKYIL